MREKKDLIIEKETYNLIRREYGLPEFGALSEEDKKRIQEQFDKLKEERTLRD